MDSAALKNIKSTIERLKAEIAYHKKKAIFSNPNDVSKHSPNLPYLYYDPISKGFCNQNSYGKLYKIRGLNTFSFNESKLLMVQKKLKTFFQYTPDGFGLQFIKVVINDVATYQADIKKTLLSIQAEMSEHPEDMNNYYFYLYLEDFLSDISDKVETSLNQPKIIENYLAIYKTYPFSFNPDRLKFRHKFGFLRKHQYPGAEKDLTEVRESFEKGLKSCLNNLEKVFEETGNTDEFVSECTEGDLIRFLRQQFLYQNPEAHIYREGTKDIISQSIDQDTFYADDGFYFLGDRTGINNGVLSETKTMSINYTSPPEYYDFGMFSDFSEIRKNFLFTVSFYADPLIKNEKENKIILNEWLGLMGSEEGIKKLKEENRVYVDKIGREKQKAFRTRIQFNFIGNEGELQECQEDVNIFSDKYAGATTNIDRMYGYFSYINGLPFGFYPFESKVARQSIKVLAESAGSILPILGNYPYFKTREEPLKSVYYQTIEGEPVFIEPKSLTAKAKHTILTSYTGGGKSVVMSHEIESCILNDGCCFAIDPGGSFKDLIEYYGGRHLTVSHSDPFPYNPFAGDLYPVDLDDQKGKRSQHKVSFLIKYMMLLAYGLDPEAGAVEISVAESILEDALKKAYIAALEAGGITGFDKETGIQTSGNNEIKMAFGDVYAKIFSEKHDDIAQKLKTLLGKFLRGARYGDFCDSDQFGELSDRYLAIDPKPIENDKTLSTIIFFLFTEYANNFFLEERKKGGDKLHLLVIDEVLKYIHGDFMSDFIKEKSLELRKNGGRLLTAPQSLMALTENGCGKAILGSAQYIMIIGQDETFKDFLETGTTLKELKPSVLSKIQGLQLKDNASHFYLFSKQNPSESGFLKFAPSFLSMAKIFRDGKLIPIKERALQESFKKGLSGVEAKIDSLMVVKNHLKQELLNDG